MTTEAVELTCRTLVQIPCPYEIRGSIVTCATLHQRPCAKPIRQRTSGPCVNCRDSERPGKHLSDAHQRTPDGYEHCVDCTPAVGHSFALCRYRAPRDPGYDHVDLEGACAECGNPRLTELTEEECEAYVPPVLPVGHEATV